MPSDQNDDTDDDRERNASGYGEIPYGGSADEDERRTPRERPEGGLQDALEGPVGEADGVRRGGAGFAAEQAENARERTDHAHPRRSPGRPDEQTPESDAAARGDPVIAEGTESTDAEPDPSETTVGVPVGESGISIDEIESGDGRQPPEPPFETRTHEIEYNQQAGYIGARDGPDAPSRTLSTTTTTLDFDADERAHVTVDRQETIITAMLGRGFELHVRIDPRYADRPASTSGTRAIVEVVPREVGGGEGDE